MHDGLASGEAPRISLKPTTPTMVLADVGKHFDELRAGSFGTRVTDGYIIYSLPDLGEFAGLPDLSRVLRDLLTAGDKGLTVAPTQQNIMDVLVCLQQRGYVMQEGLSWHLQPCARRLLQLALPLSPLMALCEPREGQLPIKDLTAYEMLLQLEDESWSWMPTPKGIDRPTWCIALVEGEEIPVALRIIYGKLEQPYLQVCLAAHRNQRMFLDNGIAQIFHGQKVLFLHTSA